MQDLSIIPSNGRQNGGQSSIDIQLAVLRHLPIPILVLSPKRTTIFANLVAQDILRPENSTQSAASSILGQKPSQLGVNLHYYRNWDNELDEFETAVSNARLGGQQDPVHDVDVVIKAHEVRGRKRFYKVLISTITADDGVYFVFSFERNVYGEDISIPPEEHSISKPSQTTYINQDTANDSVIKSPQRPLSLLKQAIFNSSDIPSYMLSHDGSFYLTNDKLREVLGDVMGGPEGCSATDFRGRFEVWDEHFTRRLKVEEYPGMILLATKKPFNNVTHGFLHAQTRARHVFQVKGECLYDDGTGEFLGGICWCNSLQEYSNFVLDQQTRRLQSHETICNLMPHMVWATNPDGYCDYFSERWYEFTGMTEEQSLGSGSTEAVHPDDLTALMEKWERSRTSGEECSTEARYRRKDGIYKWMLVRACPFRNENGEILKWYGTNTDIHELVMDRIEAARNKLQILTVLAHAEVNVFSINQDRIVTMAEGGMLVKSEDGSPDKYQKDYFFGQDIIALTRSLQPGGVPGYEKLLLDVLAGKVGSGQSEDLIKGRTYRTRVIAELEQDKRDGAEKPLVKGVLGMTIDITDLKRRIELEMDNNRLVTEEQAAKDSNKIKSQFLANMSHEMRTPTAGVIGMIELLSDDPNLNDEQREYVNSIQLSAKALLTIVNDILDFSKIESGRLDIEEVPINLSMIVGELCKLLSMFAQQKGLEFIYESSMDERLEVLGDPGRTRQILSNLLTNALKFTKQGHVKLKVTLIPRNPDPIANDIIDVQFVIEDTGIGIEKSVLDKLFRPFSQGDSSTARLYGGTGLGLTISQNLANLMHGSISLTSTPGVGSIATFSVPFKVASWCHNPQFAYSPPPNIGFRIPSPDVTAQFKISKDSSRVPSPLPDRTMTSELLNQQISSSVTNYNSPTKLSKKGGVDIGATEGYLSPEQRRKVHVLVVEDNPINQTIAIQNIRKLGFPVTAVWNGREALNYLLAPSSTQPRPDIILMDVQMPVLDGYEATRILRTKAEYSVIEPSASVNGVENTSGGMESQVGKVLEIDHATNKNGELKENGTSKKPGRLSDIPVIAMTASAIQGDREKCHKAGMDDYLAKPVEKARLEEMLVRWAGRRR